MEEFCPLCMKRGFKKKMKAIQINLEEAVWMCESEECIWPMDHKELEYIPRKVGESWSCYWNTYKPHRSPETLPQTNWDFFTPPYTPRTEVSPTASSETSTHSNDQNRLISAYSKESENSKVSQNDVSEENIITIIDNDEIEVKDNINSSSLIKNNSDFLMDITNPSASTTFPVDKLKNTSKNSEIIAPSILNSHLKTDTTRIPTIVNIESMNLVNVGNIKKLPGEKLILKGLDKKCKKENDILLIRETCKNSTLKQKVPTSSEIKEIVPVKSEKLIQNQSKIEVKTVKLEGLPVTFSYQVPNFLKNDTSLIPKKEENLESKITIENEADKSVNILSKKSIMASKMFQKFDFSELRRLKNLKKNTNEVQYINEKIMEIKKVPNPIILEEGNISNNHDSVSNNKLLLSSSSSLSKNTTESTNFENFGKTFSPHSEDSKDVISDLDSFLNEYIEDIKTSTDVNLDSNLADDDWLSSLLV